MSVNHISPEDLMALSAFLDGALDPPERSSLERRLATEPLLRAELDSLRDTVSLVKSLPRLKAPRDFTLTPAMLAHTNGGHSISPSPKTVRLVQFNRWQMASLATLAASILLVFIGLFTGFDTTNNKAPESQAFVAPPITGEVNGQDGAAKLTPSPALSNVVATEGTPVASRSTDVEAPAMTATVLAAQMADGITFAGSPAPTLMVNQAPSNDEAIPAPIGETSDTQEDSSEGAVAPASASASNGGTGSANGGYAATDTSGTNPPVLQAPTASSTSTETFTPQPTETLTSTVVPSDTPTASATIDLVGQENSGGNKTDKKDQDEKSFKVTAWLMIGLVGLVVSGLALAYTWRKR
ncbi:MAG: hypothetical protein HY862_17825 [Chloroflexi bacterium]|nr:hypothetical protein [Chloroflexota bacterium]